MPWEFLPLTEFASNRSSWQNLNRAASNTALLDPRFVLPLLEEFASGQEVLGIYSLGNEPSAMGVFTRNGRFAWQTLQPANAPLGLWVSDPSMPLMGALDELVRALPGFSLLGALSQQDPHILPRPENAARLRTLDYIRTAWIPIAGKFEDYWSARGKNLRHNINRQRNRLARDGKTTRLEILTGADEMARAVEDYSRLETSGWKGEAASAVQVDDAQGRYYRKMLEAFCETSESIVYRYFFNDKLVASDICLRRNGVLIILKTAYDESEHSTSPAQLMRHEAFRDIFDSGEFERIEFYGPVKDWHTKWTDDSRVMYHVNYYRWPVLNKLHGMHRDKLHGMHRDPQQGET